MQVAFANDSSILYMTSGASILHLDVATGSVLESKFKPIDGFFLANKFCSSLDSSKTLIPGYLSRNTTSGPVLSAAVYDAASGAQLALIEDTRINNAGNPTMMGNSLSVSPRGDTLIRASGRGAIQLWDLQDQRLLANFSGDSGTFSHDGSRLVVTTAASRTRSKSLPRITIEQNPSSSSMGAKIYSTKNGQLESSFTFSADPADEIRLSSDNKRLFTLHGKTPKLNQSHSAHVRVWDIETEQEILYLPIAVESRCFWDLQISASGDTLTGYIFSGVRGSPLQADSLVFHAAPLGPEQDGQLVARNWVNKLLKWTPVPTQIIEAIDANQFATPLVRQKALALANATPFDADKIADRCLQLILRSDLPNENYTEALTWAQSLAAKEPSSPRSRALVSALLFRLGRFEDALLTLRTEIKSGGNASEATVPWELMRRAVEVLCLHKTSNDDVLVHRHAIDLADEAHANARTYERDVRDFWIYLISEALNTQGRSFGARQMEVRFIPPVDTKLASARATSSPVVRAEQSFRVSDKNGDSVLSRSEVRAYEWEELSHLDKDGVEGLSVSEWTAGSLIKAARAEAKMRKPTREQNEIFSRLDKDNDQRITRDEAPRIWSDNVGWDTDKDDAVSTDEYAQHLINNLFIQTLFNSMRSTPPLPHKTKQLILDAVLAEQPLEMYCLNQRAWLMATCKDDAFRNGEQAVRDARMACELSDYRFSAMVDTLAAAYAEIGDFEKAVQYAEQACAELGKLDKESIAMRKRLQLYKQRKPYRDEEIEESTATAGTVGASKPLISQAQLDSSRRIRGGEPAWTADGKQLIYAMTGFTPELSYLESLDLASGETKVLCRGGQRTGCSPVDGTIAMERIDQSSVGSIWLVDKDGKNERKVSVNSYFPQWTAEGNLCFVSKAADFPQLVCVSPTHPDKPIESFRTPFSREENFALKPDKRRIAWSSNGKWATFDLEEGKEVPRRIRYGMDNGRSDWSPDGRWIVYDSSPDRKPGVYIVNVATLEPVLLADVAAIARWSPDGKTLALGLKSSNEILLLDMSKVKLP